MIHDIVAIRRLSWWIHKRQKDASILTAPVITSIKANLSVINYKLRFKYGRPLGKRVKNFLVLGDCVKIISFSPLSDRVKNSRLLGDNPLVIVSNMADLSAIEASTAIQWMNTKNFKYIHGMDQ